MAATIMHVATCIVLVVAFMEFPCAAKAVPEEDFKSSGIKRKHNKRATCADVDWQHNLTVTAKCGSDGMTDCRKIIRSNQNKLRVRVNNVKMQFCLPGTGSRTIGITVNGISEESTTDCVVKKFDISGKKSVVLRYKETESNCEKSYTVTIISCPGNRTIKPLDGKESKINYGGNDGDCVLVHGQHSWMAQFYMDSNDGCYEFFIFNIKKKDGDPRSLGSCQSCSADCTGKKCISTITSSGTSRHTFNITEKAYKNQSENILILKILEFFPKEENSRTITIGTLKKIVDPANATLQLDNHGTFILNNGSRVKAAVVSQRMPAVTLTFCVSGLQKPHNLTIGGQAGTLTSKGGASCAISENVNLEIGKIMKFTFEENLEDCSNRKGYYEVEITKTTTTTTEEPAPAPTTTTTKKPEKPVPTKRITRKPKATSAAARAGGQLQHLALLISACAGLGLLRLIH